jgi:hypothetical protein
VVAAIYIRNLFNVILRSVLVLTIIYLWLYGVHVLFRVHDDFVQFSVLMASPCESVAGCREKRNIRHLAIAQDLNYFDP